MTRDERDRLVDRIDHLHRENQFEVLGIPVFLGGTLDV